VQALLVLGACAQPLPASPCSAPLKPAVEVDLYFGRSLAGGEVSEADWSAFLASEVTPRFPDGLSVVDVAGQFRGSSGAIARERTKLLIVVVFDPPAHASKVQAIVEAYKSRFRQQSVLRVEHPVCAGT
jgi:hypothetical protein